MKARRPLLIQGHPDVAGGHLCHALADTCAEAALGVSLHMRRAWPGLMERCGHRI